MNGYNYRVSLKSKRSDELINIWLIRPVAGWVVRKTYTTSITPNQLTFASIIAGLAAAWCISYSFIGLSIAAALLIEVKDILDSADGQLARAKQLASRRGRFYDSLGDVAVNALLFYAIAARFGFEPLIVFLSIAGFAGMTLRVSYHVYYQVMFLHLEGKYELNRPQESFTDADRMEDRLTRMLQRIHLIVYGWQDRLMAAVDRWCWESIGVTDIAKHQAAAELWYGDPVGLRLSGLVGLGTELALLAVCTLLDSLRMYLWLNLLAMNAFLAASVVYRRHILSRQMKVSFVDEESGDEGNLLPHH